MTEEDSKKFWRRETPLALLLILVLASIAYGFLLRPGQVLYSPHSDIVAEHLATKTVLRESLRAGSGLPFWRSDQLSGYPALTNPQAMYTYPLHFLFLFLEPAPAVGPTVWIHFVVAALAMYFVGRALGLGLQARVLMAVAGLFNFKMILAAYPGWISHLPGIALFPLLFAAVFHLLNRPGVRRMLLLALAGALCLHTGHLQYAYYAAWFVAACCTVRLAGWGRKGEWGKMRLATLLLAGATLLGAGLAAYLLLPLAGEASLLSRAQPSYEFFVSGHALKLRQLLTFFHPRALGSFDDPAYLDTEPWEDSAYFGLVPLVAACFGVSLGRRRPQTWTLAVLFVISVVLALETPLLRLAYSALPGFKLFRCPSRFLFFSAFFGIALAGIGFDEIAGRLAATPAGRRRAAALTVLLAAAMTVEGVLLVRTWLRSAPRDELLPTTDYSRFFAADRELFRIAPFFRPTINYGWAAPMGLQLATGYDPFTLGHYRTYFEIMGTGRQEWNQTGVWTDLTDLARSDMLDALNVKYVVSPGPLALDAAAFEEVASWTNQPLFELYRGLRRTDLVVYRNKAFLPRAFWADKVLEAGDLPEMIALVSRTDLHAAAVVLGATGAAGLKSSPDDRAEVTEARAGHLRLKLEAREPRFLVISEVWHPGWKAVLDGRALALVRCDIALMGAWIPPGKHTLELRFRPLWWRTGLVLSGLSLSVVLVLSAVWLRPRRETCITGRQHRLPGED